MELMSWIIVAVLILGVLGLIWLYFKVMHTLFKIIFLLIIIGLLVGGGYYFFRIV